MTIEFRCQACSKLLRVPAESAGKKARCPACSTIMDVPSTIGSAPSEQSAFPPQPGQYATTPTNYAASPPPPTSQGSVFPPASGESQRPPGYGSPPTGGSPFAASNPYADSAQAANPYAAPRGSYPVGYASPPAPEKVKAPAIALLVVSALPILFALFLFVMGAIVLADGDDDGVAMFVVGVLGAGMGMIPALAGFMMLRLRAYGLCMTLVIISIVVSMLASCFPLAGVAIWAVVVLADSRVKAAFQ